MAKKYSHAPRRRKRAILYWFIGIDLLIALILLIVFWSQIFGPATHPAADNGENATNLIDGESIDITTVSNAQTTTTSIVVYADDNDPAPGPRGMTKGLSRRIGPSPITVDKKISKAQAEKMLKEGMDLFAANKDLLKARSLLNDAYISGQLAEPRAIGARKALENIADRTVLAGSSHVNPKDQYMQKHTFQTGDMLNSTRKASRVVRKGVIAKFDLNVPADILVKVNRLRSSGGFQAGKSYKLLKGPFHLVVYKQKRVADLFLQDLFVRRIPICIGAPETPTPVGYFRLAPYGKTMHSSYNAPIEANQPSSTLMPSDEGYPLDALGHNIKIEGIGQLGTDILVSQSYAIHGTNDEASIGSAASRGCIRVDDRNIKLLYGTLQSYADPTNPNVTWKRWSTVTIKD